MAGPQGGATPEIQSVTSGVEIIAERGSVKVRQRFGIVSTNRYKIVFHEWAVQNT
jgi:hypothetical protein